MFSQIPPLTPAWNLIFMVNSSGLTFAIHNTISRYMHPVILAWCDFRHRVSKFNLILVTLRRL